MEIRRRHGELLQGARVFFQATLHSLSELLVAFALALGLLLGRPSLLVDLTLSLALSFRLSLLLSERDLLIRGRVDVERLLLDGSRLWRAAEQLVDARLIVPVGQSLRIGEPPKLLDDALAPLFDRVDLAIERRLLLLGSLVDKLGGRVACRLQGAFVDSAARRVGRAGRR